MKILRRTRSQLKPAAIQLSDSLLDLLDGPGECLPADLQQMPRLVPELLDNTHKQTGRRSQTRLTLPPTSASAPPILDLPKDLKDRRSIRSVVVDQQQWVPHKPGTTECNGRNQGNGACLCSSLLLLGIRQATNTFKRLLGLIVSPMLFLPFLNSRNSRFHFTFYFAFVPLIGAPHFLQDVVL